MRFVFILAGVGLLERFNSVAIIAASSEVDLPFVMALQTIRLFVVILIGPTFASIVARRMLVAKPSSP